MTWIDVYVVIGALLAMIGSCAPLTYAAIIAVCEVTEWWESGERWYALRWLVAVIALVALIAAIITTGMWVIDAHLPAGDRALR